MPSKQAFIVVGPESSGTRLLTRCLVAAGCHGDAGHEQPFDDNPGQLAGKGRVVWRRSAPHGFGKTRKIRDLEAELLQPLRDHGFQDVRVFALIRNHYCMVRSQVIVPHVRSIAEAEQNIPSAMKSITDFVTKCSLPTRFVIYEELVHRSESFRRTFAAWGLDASKLPAFTNRNERFLAENISDEDYEAMGRVTWELRHPEPDLPPLSLEQVSRRSGLPLSEVERHIQKLSAWAGPNRKLAIRM